MVSSCNGTYMHHLIPYHFWLLEYTKLIQTERNFSWRFHSNKPLPSVISSKRHQPEALSLVEILLLFLAFRLKLFEVAFNSSLVITGHTGIHITLGIHFPSLNSTSQHPDLKSVVVKPLVDLCFIPSSCMNATTIYYVLQALVQFKLTADFPSSDRLFGAS